MPGRFRDDELVLPLSEPFDEDEALMAHVAVGIARAGGKMFEGRLLECRVGRLLGARFPRVGISPWDLRLPDGTTIEVKTGTRRFSLYGPKVVDLWIFVQKPAGPLVRDGNNLRYFVATNATVASVAVRGRSLSVRQAAELGQECTEAELPTTVQRLAAKVRTKRRRRAASR